ncbi:Epimerase domain-containing protein [Fusarium sp. LHS14.1]|nr:Epimerase domain-containing protein [Fusarium sp. LHS14.1]
MKILIVGGTGMIGGHAALHLRSLGHEVAIAGRRPPPSSIPGLAQLEFVKGDFTAGDIGVDQLSKFDAVVFTAGSDIRHVPENTDADQHYLHVNGTLIPDFARLAKSAGVRHFIHVGSFYYHVAPELIDNVPYVRSRKLAADGVIAQASPTFHASSLDAPFVVGTVPGMKVPMFDAYVRYAKGELPIPPSAPVGGTNFISAQSLSEAIAGALASGPSVSGKAILVGDENLTFAAYFELFFKAVGKETQLPVLDQDHPLLPRATLFTGTKTVSYEPVKEEWEALGSYRRNDIQNAITEIVEDLSRQQA